MIIVPSNEFHPENGNMKVHEMLSQRAQFNLDPDYQRELCWKKVAKQNLVLSMIFGYRIGVISLHDRSVGEVKSYDVVDGKQRIDALIEFFEGRFRLPVNSPEFRDKALGGRHYLELPDEARFAFDHYMLQIVYITGTKHDIIGQFVSLNRFVDPLSMQEVRDAYGGYVCDEVKRLDEHPLWRKIPASTRRANRRKLIASLLLCVHDPTALSRTRGGHTMAEMLDNMYADYTDVKNSNGIKLSIKRVERLFNKLETVFPSSQEGFRGNRMFSGSATFIHIGIFLSLILEEYVTKDKVWTQVPQWIIEFLDSFGENRLVVVNDEIAFRWASPTLTYATHRRKLISRSFFAYMGELQAKDERRKFTSSQRDEIWDRSDSHCAICGVEVRYDEWDAGHIVAWSQGGRTTVANGQVECIQCNRAHNLKDSAAD